MKRLVVYDTTFENTANIARAIAASISAEACHVNDAGAAALSGVDLLVVGSPTHGGKQTPAIQGYLDAIDGASLRNKPVAAFDTRISAKDRGIPLRLLMRLIGYAAPRIARKLQSKGGELVAPPEGFIVEGKEGPLRAGELERAKRWLVGVTQ